MGSAFPSDQTVLISGGSGFVASHVVKRFLEAGYKTRTTVRTNAAKEKVQRIQKNHPNLSFAIVPDGQAPGAYDEAVKGVDGVIHTASPFVTEVDDNERDLLNPAIRGTEGILKSIKANNPKVKRVVITSSFASIVDLSKGLRSDYTYTEADWNPVTYDFAKTTKNGEAAYCASKTFAEKAAWDFVENEKPNFNIASICPPMVYGPAVPDSIQDLNLRKLNTSSADIYRFLNGVSKEVPDTAFFGFVDVRDVAEAHLKAYALPSAGGQRYFITAGRYTYQEVCDIIRKEFPQLKEGVPEGQVGYRGPESYAVSNEKAKKELGMDFISLEQCVKDMVEEFLTIERKMT